MIWFNTNQIQIKIQLNIHTHLRPSQKTCWLFWDICPSTPCTLPLLFLQVFSTTSTLSSTQSSTLWCQKDFGEASATSSVALSTGRERTLWTLCDIWMYHVRTKYMYLALLNIGTHHLTAEPPIANQQWQVPLFPHRLTNRHESSEVSEQKRSGNNVRVRRGPR